MEKKIDVVNLNSYNNGRTRGKWYELTVDFSRIKSDLLFDVEHREEYAIHDFEKFYGYKVGEYSSIQELNEYAEKLEDLEIYSIDDIIDNKDDLDFVESEMMKIWDKN
nr:antirestriction protein ArdA [Lactococcus lactis]